MACFLSGDGSKPGDNDACDNDGDAEHFSRGYLFLQDESTHHKDPYKAGSSDAGHDRERYMAQSHLVDGQCQEEEAVGDNESQTAA